MEYPWDWIFYSVYVYWILGGTVIAPIYMATSEDKDDNRRFARGILMVVLWGPIGLVLAVKWIIKGSWWIVSNAVRKD